MKLLTRLMALQEAHGALSDELLGEVSRETGTPLYHLEGLRSFYPVFRTTPATGPEVHVCRDVVCEMRGGPDVCGRVREAVGDAATVVPVSCLGRCERAPAALIGHTPVGGSVDAIAAATSGDPAHPEPPSPTRWPVDPYESPDERYGALRDLLAAGAAGIERVLAELEGSGLRGMGGAGFPTGRKWAFTRQAKGTPKYVVCNADESEPGTFKDRQILADLPHLLLEAMAIAGRTIGADQGIVYLRHEYGPEHAALERAIAEAEAAGALGDNLFGSGARFRVRVFVSPGGYIMGEETALLEALEDKRGEPRNKPPFPTTHGLHARPTLMNNVETLAAVPAILLRGADWWRAQGRGEAPGWKFIAVSGDVTRPGVVCVPLGATAREVIGAAGGMAEGRELAAFFPGGVSSDLLPGSAADVAMDFDSLAAAGSMLGSGALIAIGSGRDLAALAVNAVRFFRNESCGKCVPCRAGSEKAVAMLDAALAGRPEPGLGGKLGELGETLRRTSICGLGQVALQPALSAMARFPEVARRLNGNGDVSGRSP